METPTSHYSRFAFYLALMLFSGREALAQIRYSVAEEVDDGTVVGNVAKDLGVKDKDFGVNGKIISSIINEVPFELKPSYKENTYSVVTKDVLDREVVSHYEITIKATDCGEPPLSTFKTLRIEISDVNDNSPHFKQNPLEFYLVENNAAGKSIFSVSASDNDLNDNAAISYHIMREGSQNDVMSSLNINKVLCQGSGACLLELKILVENPLEMHYVVVEITDVNDHSPNFSERNQRFEIAEHTLPGRRFQLHTARDPDAGLNSIHTYTLTPNDHFELDVRQSDEDKIPFLVLKKSLDREQKCNHSLVVTAVDGAKPPRSGTLNVTVIVLDSNDNRPMFITSLSNTVTEDSKPGTVISLISVTDKDSGLNGKIITHMTDNAPFELKPSYKENIYSVVTKGVLDRETVPEYEVIITATDCGEPPLSSFKTLSIQIADVNDNSPQFTQNPLQCYLTENNFAGAPIFSVSAVDLDANENAAISYHLLREGGENYVISFLNVNSDNGQITALKSFDFESLKTFQFQVVASDSGTPPLSNNVTVNVFILDQNDNAPVILYPLSSNGSAQGVEEIPRNVNAGHLVTKVRAYDADIGYNGWLLFSLQEVTDHSLFALDRYTGQIRTLRSFTETDEAEHKLLILVKDNGNVSLSATATVIVKLVEPKEAFAASDVKSAAKDDEDSNVIFYLMVTLGAVSVLFLISIIVLIAMQCSKSTDYTSKYLPETNYDGTLCHSIQYRSGEKRYMLVGPRMSIGSTIVPGSHANTLVMPDRRRTSEEVRLTYNTYCASSSDVSAVIWSARLNLLITHDE
uniref:Cadherin domain-containing protein n=1 Tax=Astatotilapia calliptera TaxID=8154 RepID=A0A3P8PG22_ASTCA